MLPSGSPPFASWTDFDHSSAVIIVIVLCMLYWVVAGILQQTLSFARGIRFPQRIGSFRRQWYIYPLFVFAAGFSERAR